MTKPKVNLIELAKNIGHRALWSAGNGLKFEVEIMSVRVAFGLAQYTIQPVAGEGQVEVREGLEIK